MTNFRKVELGMDDEGNLKILGPRNEEWRDFPGVSQPYSAQVVTAAQIISRNSGPDNISAIEIADIEEGDFLLAVWFALDSTLDGDYIPMLPPMAYTPGASTTDVFNQGDTLDVAGQSPGGVSTYFFSQPIDSNFGAIILTGAAVYVLLTGSTLPTSGSITFHYLKSPAS